MRANGVTLSPGDLMVYMPGTEMEVTTLGHADVICLHLAPYLLEQDVRRAAPDWWCAERTFCLRSRAPGARSLLALASALLSTSGAQHSPEQCAGMVAELLARALTESHDPILRLPRRRIIQLQALDRARAFIDGHLGETIRMTDLCHHAGVSLKTLERLFRRELQASPSEYVERSRLDRVRRILAGGADSGRTVTEIATEHGFRHLGRFAAAYRRQFGEYPSQVRPYRHRSR